MNLETDGYKAKVASTKNHGYENNNIDILFNLAECYQSLGEIEKAKEYAYKILNLDSNKKYKTTKNT